VSSGRAALALAAAGLAAYAGWVEPRRLVVRHDTLALPRWPAALSGLRVGVITDLHAGVLHVSEETVGRWVARMNAEGPDLVLLGGDFTDAHWLFGGRLAPERVGERLAALQAPLGRIAVLGNHDWKQAGARMWLALERAGITVLENASTGIETRATRFHVAGLADYRIRRPDVVTALRDVPDGEAVVLLSHDPDAFPTVPGRVSLTIAGHTHGGQVAVPIVRRPFIPSRYGERYARGHVVEHGRHLVVGAGLGTSGLPVRLLAPPELIVLELRSGA
jgi:predicted MPP superfamily phosphohydrolase